MRALVRFHRLLLRAYPPPFRRAFGPAMAQALQDQHRHGGAGAWRLLLRESTAVAATAPKMRWESVMVRITATVVFATAAVVLVLVAGPAALLLVAAAGVTLVVIGRRQGGGRPIEAVRPSARWFAAGVAALLLAVAIPVLDGGELSAARWSAMALFGLAGIGLLLTGLVTATTRPAPV